MNESIAEHALTERSLTVEIKLYYDLQTSENSVAPAPLLIAVHGYGGSKRAMMREARAVAPTGFAVAALQGFHQHWRERTEPNKMPKVGFSWLTDYKAEESVAVHHKAVGDLIQNLVDEGVADARQIYLLGFSQSCALNFRFAFKNPELLRGVIGISGGIPSDWETNTVYQPTSARIFYLYGSRDEFYPLDKLDENAERLKLRAVNLTTRSYDAAHEITDEMRADLRTWLQAK